MSIELIVFDLDDTLLDTTNLLIPIARTAAFEKRIREPLPLMPGAEKNLKYLFSRYDLALLTQGRIDAQKEKIKSLGIEQYFSQILIFDPSLESGVSKKKYFEQIVQEAGLTPNTVLSIGNRRTTDIREAKRVGAMTCLFKYGEHQSEVIEIPEDKPDFEINDHSELIQTCNL
jgi:putative hydrolase of the HAD superfamily